MKTIKEAKDDCILDCGCLNYRESDYTAGYANGVDYGFISGVEFAQRWISVEEEIPRNVWLNVKHDLKNMYGVVNIAGSIDYNFVKSNFTHWRPIELK